MSEQEMNEGSEFEVEAVGRGRKPQARHDVAAELSPAKRRKLRQPKARHDVEDAPPVDGFLDPLKVTGDPKFKLCWVTQADRERHFNRPWRAARYGISKVKLNFANPAARKGEEIRFRELTLMEWPAELHEQFVRTDPARVRHQALQQMLEERAEKSGGYTKHMTTDLTV